MQRILVLFGLFLVIVIAGAAIPAIDAVNQSITQTEAQPVAQRLTQMWALLVIVPTAGAALWAAFHLVRR